ncbi:type IV secretion protein [Shewanella sp. 202IG2-18]|uniref:type IV secretion system protein n=1 Tax=Parashewanella hymeniacidonis TaxID=2807618 RepID=UPI001960B165|nr:type IV secretion system protein [Parashewanella hymeniacidonis]MBM7074257.1 type IV secretion protein [Parashewanella hymeniacidonis]
MKPLLAIRLKALGTRFHGYDGKGTTLVIPACSKRESSDFFYLKILKSLGTRFHGYDGLIMFTLFLPLSAHAFPVIDAANLQQNIIQVKHLLEEINTLKQQLSTAKSQLSSINGVRHMSGVIDSVYDISVKVDPNLTLKQQGLHNSEWLKLGGDMAGLYDQVNRYRGRWFGQTQISLQQTQARYNQLIQLIRKIDNAPQQKDIEDLQARINAEGVMLQNEQAKLQLLDAQAKASDALTQQRITQMAVESAGELKPIDW